MNNLLRAEIRKFRWTRSLWMLAAAAVVISVGSGTILVVAFKPVEIADRLSEHGPLRFGLSNVGLMISLLGIRLFGDEVQHHTLAATLLREPNRTRVLAAKVAMAMGLSLAITGVIYLLVVPSAVVIADARGLGMAVDAGATATLFVRVAGAMALLAALGVGLAAALRNRTVALISFVLGITLGESIVGGLLKIPDYMPSALVSAIVSGGGPDVIAPGLAFALLAALAAVASGAAFAVTQGDVG